MGRAIGPRMLTAGICAWLYVALVWPLGVTGQSSMRNGDERSAMGALSGFAYCGDSGLPARFATVSVQSISSLGVFRNLSPDSDQNSASTQTDINGRFFLDNLPSGSYLILVSLPGYLEPLAQYTWHDLVNDPTTSSQLVRNRFQRSLTEVTIEPNQVSQMAIRLEKGAEIGGRVSYDDGSAATGLLVNLLRRAENGREWQEVNNGSGLSRMLHTDDRGQFRITGLPAGKYLLCVRLPPDVVNQNGLSGGATRWRDKVSSFSDLHVYFGDTIRQSQAKVIELSAGEVRADINLQIPVSSFHTLSGNVVTETGNPLKSALVMVNLADDGSNIFRVHVGETGAFEIPFVLDGDYSLIVSAPLWEDKFNRKHVYKSTSMSLHVAGDLTEIRITLPETTASVPRNSP